MTSAYLLFSVIVVLLGLLIWGRWRYDVVAFFALMLAVLVGVVSPNDAFNGFSNPAVITVACVMVITRAISQSGIVNRFIQKCLPDTDHVAIDIFGLGAIAAVLSAFMNNVGALALMMPVAIQSAILKKRSPSLLLLPLAFASVLGGLMTVIGTPPNILISAFREQAIGRAYNMFDFAPVGLVVAFCGLIYIALVGWRLIPEERRAPASGEDKFKIQDYITEIKIGEGSKAIDITVRELEHMVEGDFVILGLIRNKRKKLVISSREVLKENDILIVEASHEDLKLLLQAAKLELYQEKEFSSETLKSDEIVVMEAVVPPGSRVEGRTPASMRLRGRYHLNLLAISRQGSSIKSRLNELRLRAGDVLLLQGEAENLRENTLKLGFLPLVERDVSVTKEGAWLPILFFAVGITLLALRLLSIQIAFGLIVLALILFKVMPLRRVYETIEWPIIILLGSIIPIGAAMQATGGTDMIAQFILSLAGHFSPIIMLGLLLVITMTLSDVMNNAATAVVMAPIALSIANALHANVDPFLMTVAVGASCSFLTPIGHQNNTLVMGPGGYKFFDYFRVGLPLEVIVVLVGLPMIVTVWPL